MTEEQEKLITDSKEIIKKEGKIITEAVTRMLMVGGPQTVEAILLALLDTNRKIMDTLKYKMDIEFNEDKTK